VAADGVDLEIGAGEIVCLVGPSGCGKTTLLRLIAGLEDIQAGRIDIDGETVADAAAGVQVAPDRRGVGLVFQDHALFPHLTVLGNAAFGLSDGNAAARQTRARRALAQVGMTESVELYPHTLSGGQQQRVALARALAPGPRLMLLDEPFSDLDTRLRERVRDDTLHILKNNGAATLIVTHDAEEAMFLADRIAVMRRGRIVQTGSPTEIYCRPASAFVAEFFSYVNRIRGTVANGRVKTPLGELPAGGAGEGEEVEVLIRTEAIQLTSPREEASIHGCAARVIAARLLGRSSIIHLSVADGHGGDMHLHSRMPGLVLPAEGDIVGVMLDPRQTFVFPAENKG